MERHKLSREEFIATRFDTGRYEYTRGLLDFSRFGEGGQKLSLQELFNTPHTQVRAALYPRLMSLINGVEVMRVEDLHGVYNDHTFGHIFFVDQLSEEILRKYYAINYQKDPPNEELVLTSLIALLHDIGNNLTRHRHYAHSAGLAYNQIFDHLDPKNDPFARSLINGIIYHHEGTVAHVKDLGNLKEQIPYLQCGLAVIIADKIHIDASRTDPIFGEKSKKDAIRILNENEHSQMVVYARGPEFRITPEKAQLKIRFSSKIDEGLYGKTKKLLQQFTYRPSVRQNDMWVKDRWYDLFKIEEGHLPFVVSYAGSLRQIYAVRLAVLSASLFHLFPSMNQVEVEIFDPSPLQNVSFTQKLDRDTWRVTVFNMWKQANNADLEKDILSGKLRVPGIINEGLNQFISLQRQPGTSD